MWKSRLQVFALTFLISAAFLFSIVKVVKPAWIESTGDFGKVNIIINYWPGKDAYGNPSVNPDGSFYPNDQLWIKYSVYVAEGLNFGGVEAVYNEAVFEKLQDSGWGSTSGKALFKVRPDAAPGKYDFTVRAEASATTTAGESGSVTVSVGGVNVYAYYGAEYMLTILPTSNGTTVPAPGSYWHPKGSYVSVTAIPNANYTFSHWILDGANAGSNNPIDVFMDGPHSLTAVFKPANASQTDAAAFVADGAVKTAVFASSQIEKLKLIITDLKWATWFDFFRGTICRAMGYLYDSNGEVVPLSDVVVEFHKKNFWTGASWIVQKTVKTNSKGFFAVEDTCSPLYEMFLGVQAWAEKPGYIPSWSLSLFLDPYSASVGQGSGFLVGIRVYLSGRYTAVPIALTAMDVPSGCTVFFEPATGEVDWFTPFQSVMAITIQPTAQIGSYFIKVRAESGIVSDTSTFSLRVTEPVRIPSSATFTARGLDPDAVGLALTLDNSLNVNAEQLPYTANWESNTKHTYRWQRFIGSRVNGKRYVLNRVVVVQRYVAIATVEVEVVEYDPQFTVVLAYTIPKGHGDNSYEKPFAMIIRYDGNGPEKKLGQRAVIEGWSWSGRASRISVQQQLTGLTSIPGLSNIKPEDIAENFQNLLQIFNLTKGVTFSVTGIDAETEGVVLKVDGESLFIDQLPKTYNWPENTTHVYEWSVQMPVYEWVGDPKRGAGRYENVGDEWFAFEYAQVLLPQFEVSGNMTLEQLQEIGRGFSAKLYSPVGKLNATAFGNKVVGVYSHNKLLSSIAEAVGAGHDALKCISADFPVYFTNESRYAKFVFDLEDKVAAEVIRQSFNKSIHYTISFMSSMFTPHTFKADFTCPLEYYFKAVNATAFKWDPAAKRWAIDSTAMVEIVFDGAFNTTEADWFSSSLREQTADEEALKLASEDIFECRPQYFGGLGSASGIMNRTSSFLYNLNATAGRGYYTIGSLPQPPDSWTEKVETKEAWWSSPTSTLAADSGFRAAGLASIKADEKKACNASAILTLLKPIRSRPSTLLRFKAFLDDRCSGRIFVYMSGQGQTTAHSLTVPTESWVEVAVGNVPYGVRRIGIYVELQEEGGSFWVDDLRFTGVDVWVWTERSSVEKTVYVNFATNEPFRVYVNLDPNSPLPVNVTADNVKTSRLTVDAAPELGGLTRLTVYLVVDAPAGYSLSSLPVERLQLQKLFTVNLTVPEGLVEWAQLSGYRGYSAIHGGVLGFTGQKELLITKDPEMKALPGYDATLLLIEAENVWGTTFRTVVAVQPWGKTLLEITFEQVALALFGVAIAAIVVGLVIRFLRESKGQA